MGHEVYFVEYNRKKNVMFVSYGKGLGGAQEIILNLALNLDKSKYKVSVATLLDSGKEKLLQEHAINYVRYYGKTEGEQIKSLERIISDYGIDIVYCNFCPSAHFAAQNVGVKTIEIVHGMYTKLYRESKKKYIEILKKSSKIICVSKLVYDFMTNFFQFPGLKEKMIIIENGISEAKFQTTIKKAYMRKKLGIPDKAIVIGNLGRLAREKGIERIIEVARILNERFDNLYFVIPGDFIYNVKYYNKLEQIIEKYNLKNIIFPGFIEKVADILQIYDIFVFPSYIEGFGLAIVEALKMGIPVVTTNVGVVTYDKNILNGECGYIINDYSNEIFANYLGKLIENKEARQKIGDWNKLFFANKYSDVKMVQEYEKLLEQLL
ncbi:MAG: glycosyltransferase family 4 protein [Halanaerobiales bacterium]|nr:glycosyltransferase family 4 protein [Halanaerobiales bacterium]